MFHIQKGFDVRLFVKRLRGRFLRREEQRQDNAAHQDGQDDRQRDARGDDLLVDDKRQQPLDTDEGQQEGHTDLQIGEFVHDAL